jgi:CRP-like cAMP-binding protein
LQALTQGAGPALRMPTSSFIRELDQNIALQRTLKYYLFVVISQLTQTVVCNHFHRIETRLARWLLMMQDRAHSDKFHVTHEFLAYVLGVRRAGVTKAATSLQQTQLIHYKRGDITILDRVGLENASCNCYLTDKVTYTRIMVQ